MTCEGVTVQLQKLLLVLEHSGAYNIKPSAALIKICICLLKGECNIYSSVQVSLEIFGFYQR